MSVTSDSFRLAFPAFQNTALYPTPMVDFWVAQALLLHNPARWGANLDFGVSLWVAHNLVLETQAGKQSAQGKPVAGTTGLVSSKSVDKVSVSFDNTTASEKDAGNWNLTTYGQRWYRLSRMAGAGPIQSGIPQPSDPGISQGWPGFIYPMP